MIFKKPEVVKKKEKLSFAHRILNDRIHSLDAIRQDSLVTKSLLDLTSYETKNEPVEDDSFDQFDDVQHPLSFDDLGKTILIQYLRTNAIFNGIASFFRREKNLILAIEVLSTTANTRTIQVKLTALLFRLLPLLNFFYTIILFYSFNR